jgi:hypothetical protein
MMLKNTIQEGQVPKLQKIFLTLYQLILLTMMQVKSLIPERPKRELYGICDFPILLLLFFLSIMVKRMNHGGQKLEFQEIFRTLYQLILLTMLQVKSMIPERQEPELQEMDRDENKLDAFLNVHKNSLKEQ